MILYVVPGVLINLSISDYLLDLEITYCPFLLLIIIFTVAHFQKNFYEEHFEQLETQNAMEIVEGIDRHFGKYVH